MNGPVSEMCIIDRFQAAGENPRYANVRLGAVVEHINQGEQTQFAAATFQLPDGHKRRKPTYKGTLVISFRGTDDSLIGWKEDFNMAFQYPVPAQRSASAYLDMVARLWEGPIIPVSYTHLLIAGADRLQHGRERHYGFAGADFALQQTLHGPVTFKIGRDVVHHLTLPGCQCERQRCDEAVAQIGQIGQIRQIGRRTALRCFWLRTWLRNRFAHRRSSCFQRLVQRARMRR